MYVRNLIRENPNWLSYLETELKIHIVRDDDLVSLKYNQIESPMHDPIVQECRGMVVDVSCNVIVAHPYNKFWNHGEPLAAQIDWTTANVFEKLDGSLMLLHYWEGNWCVASSGTPRAGGSFGDTDRTFREAFWERWKVLGMRLPDPSLESVTFMFELCDAPNRIVVKHDKPRIVLHGARDLTTGQEIALRDLEGFVETLRWEMARSYPIGSISECLAAAEQLDPLQAEGFVVVDGAFNRVKIKSPRYVILHHMKGEATPRRAIELWQTGEVGELLAHFPEMAPRILPIHEALDGFARNAVNEMLANAGAASRKDFALAVKDKPWSAACFRMYGDPSPTFEKAKAILRAQSLASLERLLSEFS